jgi:hypothetical protein
MGDPFETESGETNHGRSQERTPQIAHPDIDILTYDPRRLSSFEETLETPRFAFVPCHEALFIILGVKEFNRISASHFWKASDFN